MKAIERKRLKDLIAKKNKTINKLSEQINELRLKLEGDVVSLNQIADVVSEVSKIEKELIIGTSRKRHFVLPRHIFCHLSRKYTKVTLQNIGYFLNKNHDTVLNADNTVKNLLETKDVEVTKMFNEIEIELLNKYPEIINKLKI